MACVATLLFSVSTASAQAKDAKTCVQTTPVDAKLDMYPHVSGRPSDRQIATWGLKPQHLKYPFVGHNYYRNSADCNGGYWKNETLVVGTLVWVDQNGYVVYHGDCWNRLVWDDPKYVAPTNPTPATHQPRPYLRWLWKSAIDVITWPFIGYK